MFYQEKYGVWELIVWVGLWYVFVGVECLVQEGLGWLNKYGYGYNVVREVFGIMCDKYFQVFCQGIFIIGIWSDIEESIKNLFSYVYEIDVDFVVFYFMIFFFGILLYDDVV